MTRWIADYPDTDTFFISPARKHTSGVFCGTSEIDRLIERGRAETSAIVRDPLYSELQEVAEQEALCLPLFHEQAHRFARPEVEGLSVSFWGQTVDYSNLRITN